MKWIIFTVYKKINLIKWSSFFASKIVMMLWIFQMHQISSSTFYKEWKSLKQKYFFPRISSLISLIYVSVPSLSPNLEKCSHNFLVLKKCKNINENLIKRIAFREQFHSAPKRQLNQIDFKVTCWGFFIMTTASHYHQLTKLVPKNRATILS